MKLKDYLNITFPGLTLRPSLYYQWDIGIHFELAKGLYQFKEGGSDELNPEYFDQVYKQALAIFNDIFSDEDEIFLVTNTYQHKAYRGKEVAKLKVYSNYIKDKDLRFRLSQETLPYVFDDEEEAEDYYTSQFSLKCYKPDFRFPLLVKATCNEDFPLKPKLGDKFFVYYPDVFFINITKNIIYFVYDDRGCEVIANDREVIRRLYEKYHDWIDDYCLEDIDRRFKS